eukprot:TRINITY_DN29278_c0_g1_i1.p1 TRINITY_DN29278_c0_g1~~TRINITY_DN29278_c0_g1_i1.p1  ORF type:complete len:503 (+),score=78.47 TRINITY_DN29278_c0_g1_i1:178-1509(+)
MARIAELVVDRFEESGHQVNFAKGKSEGIVQLRGKDVRHAREALRSSDNMLELNTRRGGDRLRLVDTYHNLGNPQSFTATANKLAKHAASSLSAARATVTEQTLCSPYLTAETKRGLVDVMLTKGLFGSETWPHLEDAQVEKISRPYYLLVRQATGLDWRHGEKMIRNEELLNCGFVSMRVQLRLRRLRYLARYLKVAPKLLRILVSLNADEHNRKGGTPSWREMVRSDLAWLYGISSKLEELGDPLTDIGPWTRFIRNHPGAWKQIIKESYKKLREQEVKEPDPRRMRRSQPNKLQCDECGMHCTSAQGLHMHMVREHGARAAAAGFTDDSHMCWQCGLRTPGRGRLLQHYRQGLLRCGSASCLAQLVLNQVPRTAIEEVRRLEIEARTGRLAMKRKGRGGDDSDVWSLIPKAKVLRPCMEGPLEKCYYEKSAVFADTMEEE